MQLVRGCQCSRGRCRGSRFEIPLRTKVLKLRASRNITSVQLKLEGSAAVSAVVAAGSIVRADAAAAASGAVASTQMGEAAGKVV